VRREGTIKYPYIGYVPVAGLTVKEIEKRLADDLKDGYLINPQINVRVDVYSEKFVYVGGEVQRPGRIAFTGRNKMTLYMAIIMAGDFSKDAKKTNVTLTTTDDEGKEKVVRVDVSDIAKGQAPDPPIKADDKITVWERFF
jgi:protein involved in polysaccharide export with SLBB domain